MVVHEECSELLGSPSAFLTPSSTSSSTLPPLNVLTNCTGRGLLIKGTPTCNGAIKMNTDQTPNFPTNSTVLASIIVGVRNHQHNLRGE
jgi:hypothetical protein